MSANNVFPFVAFVTGEKTFKDILELVEYPYWLKKRKFWFYPYEGEGCIPVEKYHPESNSENNKNIWIRIYTKDNLNSKIDGQAIAKLVLGLQDGKYIVDTNRMKVIYDLTVMDSLDCYFSVNVPGKNYNSFLAVSESHGGDINEIGRKRIALIKGGSDLSLVGVAALIGYSNIMITPKTPADFGHAVFKKILEDKLYIPVISSSTYVASLPEFLIPELKGDILTETPKKGIELLADQFEKTILRNDNKKKEEGKKLGENNAIEKSNYNVKLSDIVESKKLPIVTSGKMIINVEVDMQPEGEKFLESYICGEWLYIKVDRDANSLNINDLRSKINLDFIVWMPNEKQFTKLDANYLE